MTRPHSCTRSARSPRQHLRTHRRVDAPCCASPGPASPARWDQRCSMDSGRGRHRRAADRGADRGRPGADATAVHRACARRPAVRSSPVRACLPGTAPPSGVVGYVANGAAQWGVHGTSTNAAGGGVLGSARGRGRWRDGAEHLRARPRRRRNGLPPPRVGRSLDPLGHPTGRRPVPDGRRRALLHDLLRSAGADREPRRQRRWPRLPRRAGARASTHDSTAARS